MSYMSRLVSVIIGALAIFLFQNCTPSSSGPYPRPAEEAVIPTPQIDFDASGFFIVEPYQPQGIRPTVDPLGHSLHPETEDIKQLETGGEFGCYLTVSKKVKCWGYFFHFIYLNNSIIGVEERRFHTNKNTAVEIKGLGSVQAVSAGTNSVCALIEDGTVKCWGSNHYGELGNNTFTDSYQTPVLVNGLNNIASLSVGTNRACAVQRNGNVKCWGLQVVNKEGDYESISSPVTIPELTQVYRVKVGDGFACALLISGRVSCWGAGPSLGSSATFISDPQEVAGLYNVISLSIGRRHACVVLRTGAVSCWGKHSSGALSPAEAASSTPISILNVNEVVQLVSGNDYSCATEKNGQVKCWGSDSGVLIPSNSFGKPTSIFDGFKWITLSAGSNYLSCMLGAFRRSIKCWNSHDPTFGTSGNFVNALE